MSGPSLFTLADIGGYVCVLSHAGPDALSVTTNLTINFMRKAQIGPIDGHCRILKLGKSLMVFDIDAVAATQTGRPVAHATGTYAIPPKRCGSRQRCSDDHDGRLDDNASGSVVTIRGAMTALGSETRAPLPSSFRRETLDGRPAIGPPSTSSSRFVLPETSKHRAR